MIVFDGTSSSIVDLRTSLQCVQGNNPRSISFMIQTTTSSCSNILTTGNNVNYQVFGIGFSCGNGVANIIQVYSINADYHPTSGKEINDGVWHSVSIIYDGTTLSIYVDGILDNTATSWNTWSTSTIASTLNTVGNSGNYLGVWVDGISDLWVGQLQNVLFYDYVLAFAPSSTPTMIPSIIPTTIPTTYPSQIPTLLPSNKPSIIPSILPTICPSVVPSVFPSYLPAIIYSSGTNSM